MAQEIEAKIALRAGELERLRTRLLEVGAAQGDVDHEENLVFDVKIGGQGKRRLRLRTFGGRADGVLTCKRPARTASAFKSRDEYEVHVADADSARELLHQLGFRPRVGYRKRREHWHIDGTVVALDRLAFGDYVEVEGEPSEIAETLALLGLSRRRHVDDGYASVARHSASGTAQLAFPRLLGQAS